MFKSRWITAGCIFILLFIAGCNGNDTNMIFTDGDEQIPADGDGDLDVPENEIDQEVIPCEEGELLCEDDSTLLVCNAEGIWVLKKVCENGESCIDGSCQSPLPDGDNLLPDGDDPQPDGDDPQPDGDDPQPDGDDPQPDGDDPLPDGDQVVHCVEHTDCAYGMACNPTGAGDGCEMRMACNEDADCENPRLMCAEMENWKECAPTPDECMEDDECEFGFACQEGEDGYNDCVDTNECALSTDCDENMVCVQTDTRWVCQPDGQACTEHSDCEFGYECHTEFEQPICLYASECTVDADCPSYQRCQVEENWKACKIDFNAFCQSDADCEFGETCDILFSNYGSCKSMNICTSDRECPTGFECESNGTYMDCVEVAPCVTDADCGFGFRCVAQQPKNLCEYANQCSSDADCGYMQECAVSGNWTSCTTHFPDVCTGDDSCAEDEYCDTLLGPLGECRSKSQCFVDEDCGEGMACESNGTFNECVAADPDACWFDFQCQEDWLCLDNTCKPQYEGMCTDIEGLWTVWISDCTLIMTGQTYEFVPKDGCNGDIRLGDTQVPAGSFDETSTSHYDLTIALVLQCTSEVTLNTVMSVDCGSCTVQLGRL